MEKITYKLDSFEGPLDLLLTLLSKNKVSIYDVSISQLLEQYMAHIRAMQELDMEVASEFLDMAARLVYLKTVSLLPKHEEEKELRQQLAGELMEYQLCRELAKELAMGFTFDSSSLKTQYTAVKNVISQYLPGLLCGSLDPDTELEKFEQALMDAGYQDILDAKQEQLDAWLAQQ